MLRLPAGCSASAPARTRARPAPCARPRSSGGCSRSSGSGTPGDRWEQEADRIAEQVVADRPTPIAGPLPVTPLVQMQEDEDEERPAPEEEDEEELQAKSAGRPGPSARPSRGPRRRSRAAGGRCRGPSAPGSSRGSGATFRRSASTTTPRPAPPPAASTPAPTRCATTSPSPPGAYDAGSAEGRRLLAHELVHTVQQGRGEAPRRRRHGDVGHPAPGGAETIQRLLAPVPDGNPVCSRPPSPRRLGVDVHEEIQSKFLKGGAGRVTELNLPFTDTTVCKSADSDRYEPPTLEGPAGPRDRQPRREQGDGAARRDQALQRHGRLGRRRGDGLLRSRRRSQRRRLQGRRERVAGELRGAGDPVLQAAPAPSARTSSSGPRSSGTRVR